MNLARIAWLSMIPFAACLAAQPRIARAAPDKQGAQAAAARPCSGKATSSRWLEDVRLPIPPATDKDQTLVVRIVVEQPYIDNVATRVTYDGLDRVFGIEWQVGKTTHRMRVPESLVTEEPVAADILDCTDKGVSMPARYTPLTAPRLLPHLIAVREKWSRDFDEMAAASTKIAAVALVISLRTTAAPATAATATAAQKSLGTVRTSAPRQPAAEPAREASSAAATAKPATAAAKPSSLGTATAGATTSRGSLTTTQTRVTNPQSSSIGKSGTPGLLPKLTDSTKTALIRGANAPVRGGATAAGRALQKHAARPDSWLQGRAHAGNHAKNAAAAERIIADILKDGTVTTASHPTFGQVIKIRLEDGSGAWWKESGVFIGFLERFTRR